MRTRKAVISNPFSKRQYKNFTSFAGRKPSNKTRSRTFSTKCYMKLWRNY